MPEVMKRTLCAVSPSLYRFVRNRYHARLPYNRLLAQLGRHLNWTVAAGPFAGMKYLRSDCCERSLPKLLGSYEQELWPALRQLSALPITDVINIGCAEGYYAVGLARLIPDAIVHAFDGLAAARASTRRAAEANGVAERMLVAGACDAHALAAMPLQGALVVIDCEGAEFEILDPAIAPGLEGSWMLVELHDFIDSRITPELRRRFSKSHQIEVIDAAPRDARGWPELRNLTAEEQTMALDENRNYRGEPTRQQWAFLRPKRIGVGNPR